MTWYKKDGKWLKEDGKWAISENCCCGDYWCVRDLHNYHVYSSIFDGDKFYVSKRPDGGDAVYTQASQNEDDEWLFCTESIEINDGNGVYVFLEEPEEGEELDENDIYPIYPQGDSDGYRCIKDCECVHIDGKKCCNECDGRALSMRCIRSWEFDENTMEFIAAHADEQKCYDNCGKWYCFGDQQCCEDDDEDCDEDTIDYECRFGSSDEGNKLSGPYLEESDCTENCKEPPECPTCVKEACKYIFDPPPQCEDPSTDPPDCEDLPGQGGGWANCCDDLRERWRYEDEDWVLLHPCSEDFNAPPGAGTPACKVTTREFPNNPEENEIKDFPCEIDWEFEPPEDNEACGETGGCGYACVPDEDDPTESGCVRDPSGNRKTLEECENKCPEKWQCTAVNECELNGDGEYDTEEECVNRSVQKCGAYGACCFDGECEDGYLEQECIDEGGVYYGTSWCDENPCGFEGGTCCSFPYTDSGPQPGNTEADAIRLAAASAKANAAALGTTWAVGYFSNGEWFENAALFDPSRNQYTCTGYWTTGADADCADVASEDDCKGPFKVFTVGNTCDNDPCPDEPPEPSTGACCYPDGVIPAHCHDGETQVECESEGGTWHEGKWCNEDGECPPVDSPVPGICLYREDGVGTCTQYNVDGTDYGAQDFATKEEAQAWIDEGNCPEPGSDEPDCGMSYCYPYDNEGVWTPIVEYRVPSTDENGNTLPCDQWLFTTPSTKEYCESRPAIAGSSWQNDLPATDCKIVNSGAECTESTGTFCPDLTECPDDPSAGCPDPLNFAEPP